MEDVVKKRKAMDKVRELELKLDIAEAKVREHERREQRYESERGKMRTEREEQAAVLRVTRRFEGLYEEAKVAKMELGNEVQGLRQKMEEYQKMGERVEHKFNLKEREL